MNLFILLPITSGILLAFGQFFMKRVSSSLPAMLAFWPVVKALVISPYLYLFLLFNIASTFAYIGTLRFMSMTNTFAIVFVAMGATVLCLDVFVNRITLSGLNLLGVGLGIMAVLLIAVR